ncbi:MAG: tetratricopeptide repeat protein [Caulobacteraceae bacterium]
MFRTATPKAPARSWPWRRPTPRTPNSTACARPSSWPRRRPPRPPPSTGAWPPIPTTTRPGWELAKALAAKGAYDKAADELLLIIQRDREWNDQAARKQLLDVFEAAGQMSDVAKQGRKRLSAILFS